MASARRTLLLLSALALVAPPETRAVDPDFRIHADEFPPVPLPRVIPLPVNGSSG